MNEANLLSSLKKHHDWSKLQSPSFTGDGKQGLFLLSYTTAYRSMDIWEMYTIFRVWKHLQNLFVAREIPPRLYKNCTFLWAVSSIRLCANCDVILRLTDTLTYNRVDFPFCTEPFFPTSIFHKIGEERCGTLHCTVLCHEATDMIWHGKKLVKTCCV
jgi:hypothetical protein